MARTYWHLEPLKRKPTDYEVATSKLLWHPQRGFEVELPAGDWYRRYQKGSPFQCSDWERFADPRETTYTTYTTLRARQEIFVDGLLDSIDATGYDQRLSPDWLRTLGQVLGPLRYPVHGLQLAAAYVGSMAPAGRIAICALFQTGDEIRRIQRLAYRLRQLQQTHVGLGAEGRSLWEHDPIWQPLREAIEKLLVAYDWGEAFTALNFAIKPAFDELFMTAFGQLAQAAGDEVLQKILGSLNEDYAWHREWSQALVRTALADRPQNRAELEGWLAGWRPAALNAMRGFARVFEPFGGPRAAPFGETLAAIGAHLDRHWQAACGDGAVPVRQSA